MNKTIITLGTVGLLATGGTVATDQVINPYQDKNTHYELSIETDIQQGERVEIRKDKAEVTLKGWNGEYAIRITPQIPSENILGEGIIVSTTTATTTDRDFKVTAKRSLLSKKIEYKSGDVTAFIEPKVGTGDEFDIDFILDSKPNTNVFEYKIDGADNFDFFYQPALTQKEIDEGAKRPDNVVGSYAVYHKEKANHRTGSTNYATGKVFHIYRPKAIDDKGNEVWAILNYDNGVLSVEVPQDFLDKARYPVVVDPTIGYTIEGASTVSVSGTNFKGSVFTAPATVEITQVNIYLLDDSPGTNGKVVVVANSTKNIITNGVSTAFSIPGGGAALRTATFSSNPTFIDNTSYVLGVIPESTASYFSFDSKGSAIIDTTNSYTTPANLGTTSSETKLFSIYATYTESSFSSSNYSYCKTITVDNTKVDADLSGFPMLIDITDSDLASKANSNGGDITFTDSSGNRLYYERELYSAGRLVAWASTTLANSSDTVINMYYGSTTAVSNGHFPQGVWDSNYKAVYHLPNGTTLTSNDSTSNAYNMTNNSGTATTGKLDGGVNLSGSGQYLYKTSFYVGTTVTAEAWVHSSNFSQNGMVLEQSNVNATWALFFEGTNLTWRGASDTSVLYGVGGISNSNWHHIVGTQTGTTGTLYVDGVQVSSGTVTAVGNNTSTLNIGSFDTGAGYLFTGKIDEARVSNVVRSADWIKTQYNNQSATSTFYTISSEYGNTCAAAGGGGASSYSPIFFETD